jgi:hypothetical protein
MPVGIPAWPAKRPLHGALDKVHHLRRRPLGTRFQKCTDVFRADRSLRSRLSTGPHTEPRLKGAFLGRWSNPLPSCETVWLAWDPEDRRSAATGLRIDLRRGPLGASCLRGLARSSAVIAYRVSWFFPPGAALVLRPTLKRSRVSGSFLLDFLDRRAQNITTGCAKVHSV